MRGDSRVDHDAPRGEGLLESLLTILRRFEDMLRIQQELVERLSERVAALEATPPRLDPNTVLGAPHSPEADATLKETMRKIGQSSRVQPMPDPYRTDNAEVQA